MLRDKQGRATIQDSISMSKLPFLEGSLAFKCFREETVTLSDRWGVYWLKKQ